MSSPQLDAAGTDPWPRRIARFLVAVLPFGLAVGSSTIVMAAAMIAIFGTPAGEPARTMPPGSEAGGPLEAFAGIAPIAGLVERIGGDYVHVDVLVQAGQDPHIFEPTPRQVIALSRARLFFRVGMPFEDRLIQRVAGGPSRFTVVDTAAGIAPRASSEVGEDARGAEVREGDPCQADPHVWLSPPLLKTMAGNVAAALCRADPRHACAFQANLKALHAELDDLDRRIARSLAPYRGQAFYVFHPAFGYFAEAYGLRQVSVEVEGKPPTPRQVFGLISQARRDRVRIIFLQPQFNQQVAASIAQAIGGAVVTMDSLARDVVANLKDVAREIAAANLQRTE